MGEPLRDQQQFETVELDDNSDRWSSPDHACVTVELALYYCSFGRTAPTPKRQALDAFDQAVVLLRPLITPV